MNIIFVAVVCMLVMYFLGCREPVCVRRLLYDLRRQHSFREATTSDDDLDDIPRTHVTVSHESLVDDVMVEARKTRFDPTKLLNVCVLRWQYVAGTKCVCLTGALLRAGEYCGCWWALQRILATLCRRSSGQILHWEARVQALHEGCPCLTGWCKQL